MGCWLIILILLILLLLVFFLSQTKTSNSTNKDLPVVLVDLNKYQGLWYEVARLPFFYEKDCINPTANYTLNKQNSTINVLNKCISHGIPYEVRGIATPRYPPVVQYSSIYPGSFTVKFEQNPVGGDYNVLYVDPQYQMALVGTTDRKYLWVLSRNIGINYEQYSHLISYAESLGYNVNNLIVNSPSK